MFDFSDMYLLNNLYRQWTLPTCREQAYCEKHNTVDSEPLSLRKGAVLPKYFTLILTFLLDFI